jgi:hypothetical protein
MTRANNLWMLLVGTIVCQLGICHGFVASTRRQAQLQLETLTFLKARMSDNDQEAFSRARNDARTDVRNLLTQRAIQSFMFLW